MNRRALLLAPPLALWPVNGGLAHVPFEGAGNFYGGLLHPLFTPTHALAVLALGLLAGQQLPRWRWPQPLAYVVGLGVGFAVMVSALPPGPAGEILLATAVASGMLVALAQPLSPTLGCALVFTAGVALALDSPPGVISVSEANVIIIGTFCGATILFLALRELVAKLRRHWQRIGVRIVGSWLAAIALMGLAMHMAR